MGPSSREGLPPPKQVDSLALFVKFCTPTNTKLYGSAFGEIINQLSFHISGHFFSALSFDNDYCALTIGRARAGKR